MLIQGNVMIGEQTFERASAAKKNYYFLVPASVSVVSNGTPTDFFCSVTSDSLNWTKISPKYGWGEVTNIFSFSWTPNDTISTGYLGIHTSLRNENSFSVEPTDVSDSVLSVKYATGDLFITDQNYTFYQDISLVFSYDINTLPRNLLLQVSYDGVEWNYFDDVNIDQSGRLLITSFNDLVLGSSIKFRITYNHINGSKYSIAESNWISYTQPKLIIKDKGSLENGIYDDNTKFKFEFSKSNLLNERSYVLTYLKVGLDTIFVDTLYSRLDVQYFTLFDYYKFKTDYSGEIELVYISAWGEVLNTLKLKLSDKWFTLGQHNIQVDLGDDLTFNWSNSKNFNKLTIYESTLDFGSDDWYIISKDWDVNLKSYTIKKTTPGAFRYRFVAKDGVEEFNIETDAIYFKPKYVCKEDSLNTVIDSLYTIITNIKADTLIYTIVVNELNSVLNEDSRYIKDIENVTIIDDMIYVWVRENVRNVYVADIAGSFTPIPITNPNTIEININNYASGLYLLFIVLDDMSVRTFKFLK